MGTGVAWLYSVIGTIAPDVFPHTFRMGGAVAVYFEAAAVITVLVLLGQVQERSHILKKKLIRFAGYPAICREAGAPIGEQEPAHNFRSRVANAHKVFAQ